MEGKQSFLFIATNLCWRRANFFVSSDYRIHVQFHTSPISWPPGTIRRLSNRIAIRLLEEHQQRRHNHGEGNRQQGIPIQYVSGRQCEFFEGELYGRITSRAHTFGFSLVSQWCGQSLFGQFSFVSEKFYQEGTSATRPDKETVSQSCCVTSRCVHYMCTYDLEERSCDQFQIPFRPQAASCEIDFLADERELTRTIFTKPLTSPNRNIYVKFIFPWSSPFKTNQQFTHISSPTTNFGKFHKWPAFLKVNSGYQLFMQHNTHVFCVHVGSLEIFITVKSLFKALAYFNPCRTTGAQNEDGTKKTEALKFWLASHRLEILQNDATRLS